MDIIASHLHGLAELLEQEAAGLAGRGSELVSRAIAYHHLYDHSGGRHRYALIAAVAALEIDPAIMALQGAARRARWRIGRTRADTLAQRVTEFGEALREIDRARCEAMLMAYRLVTRPGLRAAAAERLPARLVDALTQSDPRGLYLAHVEWAEARWGIGIEAAIAALAWPLAPRRVARAVRAVRLDVAAYDAAERRGWPRVERAMRASPRLPNGFAANPGQQYYRLQRTAAERRRKIVDLDLPVEQTVVLAAAA